MAPYYPPPDTNKLLHPLLACLPMAFISSQPPPALLPILSPILRQRVKLLSETRSTSEGSWLHLLCRESADAAELRDVVENMSFETHPVSGELEFGDIEKAQYKKPDHETLDSRTILPDAGLVVLYTWCTNDTEGEEDGWRISEFKPWREPSNDTTRWYSTFSEAEEKCKIDAEQHSRSIQDEMAQLDRNAKATDNEAQNGDDDDDEYWAQYDQRQSETPNHGSTPSPQLQRKPNGTSHNSNGQVGEEEEEEEYYSRYNTVQPEMDSQDPTEDNQAIGESSLHGDVLLQQRAQEPLAAVDSEALVHTRASSSSSSPIAKLEQSAEFQSQAEIAIQQHISSTIKNLHRLAKGAGMERSEFCRLIQNELDCLSLLDEE